MKRLLDKLTRFIEVIGGLFIIAMTLFVLLQIVMRFVFNSPLTWTEELARYLFIYVAFFGGAILMFRREHLFVEVVFNLLSVKVKRKVQLLIDIILFVFSVYLICSSTGLMKTSWGSFSTAMHIPIPIVNFSVFIGAVFMALFGFYNILQSIKAIAGKGGNEL
jgi:TRAP-type C4-dicarboxylate transport system permease small subunit